MERRLNELVETPLAGFIQTLTVKSPPGAAEIYDWPLVRALHIILLIQAIRASNHELHRRELRKVLHLPNENINQLAAASDKTYQLVRLRTHPRAPLFYPSDGVFVVPAQAGKGSGRFVQLIAMPVTPLYAILSILAMWTWTTSWTRSRSATAATFPTAQLERRCVVWSFIRSS